MEVIHNLLEDVGNLQFDICLVSRRRKLVSRRVKSWAMRGVISGAQLSLFITVCFYNAPYRDKTKLRIQQTYQETPQQQFDNHLSHSQTAHSHTTLSDESN